MVTPGEEEGGRLKQILEEAGFQVIVVKDAEASLRALYQGHPDLVIMSNDSLEGQEITSRIADSVRIPIIVVGKGDELSTAVMIELGADMYLIEPISPGELVARVHALLRRYRGANPGAPRLDPDRTSVEIGHNVVELTPTEFRLFSFFAMNPGKLIPYNRLLEVVWGGEDDSGHAAHVREAAEGKAAARWAGGAPAGEPQRRRVLLHHGGNGGTLHA